MNTQSNRFESFKKEELEVKNLRKETGEEFETEIIADFSDEKEAQEFKKKLILERRVKDPNALPGNKGIH